MRQIPFGRMAAVALLIACAALPALGSFTETKVAVSDSGRVAFTRSAPGDLRFECFGGANDGQPCFENDSGACPSGRCFPSDLNRGLALILRAGSDALIAENGDALGGTGSPTLSGFAKYLSINDAGTVAARVGMRRMRCTGGSNDGTACDDSSVCMGGGTCQFPFQGRCSGGSNDGEFCKVNGDCNSNVCTADPTSDADDSNRRGPGNDTERDQGAIITSNAGNTTTVIARSGDVIGTETITSPAPDPRINDVGQVAFGAELAPNGDGYAVYRFTPGTGVEEMVVRGDSVGGVTTSGGAGTGIDILDMNESGHILVQAETTTGRALILLTGPGVGTVIAQNGVTMIGANTLADVEKGTLNDLGQVLFKACVGGPCNSGAEVERLVLFTPGGSPELQEIAVEGQDADTDDPSDGPTDFEGFGRFYCLDDRGAVAFVAGLTTGQCDGGANDGAPCDDNGDCASNVCQAVDCDDNNFDQSDRQCQAVYRWDGTLRPIAQSTTAQAGSTPSGAGGFPFEWFGAGVACNDAGAVCFFAENTGNRCVGGANQGDPCHDGSDCPSSSCQELQTCIGGADEGTVCTADANCDSGYCDDLNREPSAFFCWTAAGGIRTMFTDGDPVQGSTDTDIAPPMAFLQRTLGDDGTLAFPVTINSDVPDGNEQTENRIVVFRIGAAFTGAPVLSTAAVAVVLALLFALGVLTLRRRDVAAQR